MSYRKVGGLHFIKIGRFGASFFASKPVPRGLGDTLRAVTLSLAASSAVLFVAGYIVG